MNPIVSIVVVLGLWPAVLLAQPRTVETVPGMPPVVDPRNLYSETAAGKLAPRSPARSNASTCRTASRTTST